MEMSGKLHFPVAVPVRKYITTPIRWRLTGSQGPCGHDGEETIPCPCWESKLDGHPLGQSFYLETFASLRSAY
jgi:hypothetical protein